MVWRSGAAGDQVGERLGGCDARFAHGAGRAVPAGYGCVSTGSGSGEDVGGRKGGEEGYKPARFDQIDLPFSLHVGQ